MRSEASQFQEDKRDAYNSAEQNALVVNNVERYYRTMIRGGPASWNIRDRHMVETYRRLRDFRGPDSRGIIWAHNTHVGDARATDMASMGEVNVGQLVRDKWGPEDAFVVGLDPSQGTVIAGAEGPPGADQAGPGGT